MKNAIQLSVIRRAFDLTELISQLHASNPRIMDDLLGRNLVELAKGILSDGDYYFKSRGQFLSDGVNDGHVDLWQRHLVAMPENEVLKDSLEFMQLLQVEVLKKERQAKKVLGKDLFDRLFDIQYRLSSLS